MLVPNTAMKIPPDVPTFSYTDLWEKLTRSQQLNIDVDDVNAVKLYDVSKKDGTEIMVDSFDMPVSVGTDIGLRSVEYRLTDSTILGAGASTSNLPAGKKNAYDLLMSSATTYSTPQKLTEERCHRKLTGFDHLQNDVIDWCSKYGAGWTKQGISSGEKVVKTLASALWYIEHQHSKLDKQGASVPQSFSSFQGMYTVQARL